MMKRFALFVVVLCYASSSSSMKGTQENTLEIRSNNETPPSFNKNMVSIEKAVNNFGYNLIKSMITQSEYQNIVISPTGIAGLLAMVLLGSAGKTYDEITQLLGFSQDIVLNREYHEDFGTRLLQLSSNDTKTLYANAVFVDQHSMLRDVYRSYLERVYHGEALQGDFVKSEEVKEMINEWVSNHTNGRIEDFLQQPLPVSTKVVLLSALYFTGQWAEPFILELTRELPFQTPTKEVMVDLMANFGSFDYIFSFEDGLQMISLPYNDNVTNMYVIKPRFPKRTNITELINRLNYDKIDSLITQMTKKKCVVRFPKTELKSKIDLKDSLKAIGAEAMFTPGVANFALMLESECKVNKTEDELITRINKGDIEARTLKDIVNSLLNPGVHVDSVMHQVKMTIDEFGTEAVAATSAVMARTAEMFYADSPFYMFIRNERTKLVTFSALVFDPSE